jgi:sulfite exporter TauE/SafE
MGSLLVLFNVAIDVLVAAPPRWQSDLAMISVLITVFAASVLGSLHCIGMCGPFVAFYSGGDGSRGVRRLLSHGAYSGGRLVAYVTLGLGAGSVGAALDLAGSMAGFQRTAAVIAGSVMVVWGLLALLQIRGVRLFAHRSDSRSSGWIQRGFALITSKPPLVRATAVGLLSGLLPCGWLWAFLVTAAGTGSWTGGALVMAAFWAGTVPALLAVGLGAQMVAGPLRRHAPAVTAMLLIALGVFAIVTRPTSVAAAVEKHQHSQHEVPSSADGHDCCSGE